MDVFAHDFWIDPRSGNNKVPRDVYLFSRYGSAAAPNYASDPNMQKIGSFQTLSKKSWDEEAGKYISAGTYYMTDYPWDKE